MEKRKLDWSGCPYNYEVHNEMVKGYPENGITRADYDYHKSRLDRCYEWLRAQKQSA